MIKSTNDNPETSTLGVRARQKAARPGEILEAAFDEFVANGFASARVEDIAARVGVTKGTVYVYFETKEQLFRAAVLHVVGSIQHEIGLILEGISGSAAERLERYIRSAYDLMARDERRFALIRLLIGESTRFPDLIDADQANPLSPVVASVRQLIADGLAAGEFQPSAAGMAPEIFLSPVVLFSIRQYKSGELRPADTGPFVDAHVEMVLRTLGAAPR